MRRISWLAAAALVIAPAGLRAQQSGHKATTGAQSSEASQSTQAQPQSTQHDALAEAARKAREQRQNAPKAAKVFTNDDLPTAGGISTVGAPPPEEAEKPKPPAATPAAAAAAPAKSAQEVWREKFAALRAKLDQDQKDLSKMESEIGKQQLQFYNGDPQKAVQDQMNGKPLGDEFNKQAAAIEAKKKEVADDKQAIDDAENALRKSGGDTGWAR